MPDIFRPAPFLVRPMWVSTDREPVIGALYTNVPRTPPAVDNPAENSFEMVGPGKKAWDYAALGLVRGALAAHPLVRAVHPLGPGITIFLHLQKEGDQAELARQLRNAVKAANNNLRPAHLKIPPLRFVAEAPPTLARYYPIVRARALGGKFRKYQPVDGNMP